MKLPKNDYRVYGNTVVYFLYDKQFDRTFKGTSVCQPEDAFDLETGIRIAKLKAIEKYQSFRARLFDQLLSEAEDWKSHIDEFKTNRNYWIGRVEKTVEKLNKTIEQTNFTEIK